LRRILEEAQGLVNDVLKMGSVAADLSGGKQ